MATEVRRFSAGDGKEFKTAGEANGHDRWLRWRTFVNSLGLLDGEGDAAILWEAREQVFAALASSVSVVPGPGKRRIRLRVVHPKVAEFLGAEAAEVYDVGATVRSLRGGLEGVFPGPERAEGYAEELRGIGAEGVVVVAGGVRLGVLRCSDPDVLQRSELERLSQLVKQGVVHQLVVLPAGVGFELYEEVPGGDQG